MIPDKVLTDLRELIDRAEHIVVVQADNPDADSLGSALLLEEILGEMDKRVSLYCGVDMPTYLRYIDGWDRVRNDLPAQFEASIIVDVSTKTLLENLVSTGQLGWLAAKPCAVIDHHSSVENNIDFANIIILQPDFASTGDIIYHAAKQLKWKVTDRAAELAMISILGDTQGLTNGLATSDTYRTMAELIELGADRPTLEQKRRLASKMPLEVFHYKAQLIARTEITEDGQVATLTIPPDEIKSFSPLYNPNALIHGDLLQIEGVSTAMVFKYYDDGRITASIRCNPPVAIADKLALAFGGGGHPYAAGFKITSGEPVQKIKADCLLTAQQLISEGGYGAA